MRILTDAPRPTASLAFAPDCATLYAVGHRELAARSTGELRAWDVATGRLRWLRDWPGSTAQAIGAAPDGSLVAAGGAARRMLVYDAASGVEVRHMGGHSRTIVSAAFHPHPNWLVSGAGGHAHNAGGEALVWDHEAGEPIARFSVPRGGVWSVACAPDGRVALGGGDRVVRLWSPDAASPLVERQVPDPVASVAFSADGTRLAAAAGGSVMLFDVTDVTVVTVLRGHAGLVNAVAFHPSGQSLASVGDDGTVRIWDATAGRERNILRWGARPLNCVAFAPDGLTAACGGDAGITLWDVEE